MFRIVNLNALTVPNLKNLAVECGIHLKGRTKADKIKEIKSAGIDNKKLEELYNKYSGKKTVAKKKSSIPESSTTTKRIDLLETQVKSIMVKIDNIERVLSQLKSGVIKSSESQIEVSQEHLLRIIKSVYASIPKSSGGFVPVPELTEAIKDYFPWTTKKIHQELYKLFSEYKVELQPGKSKGGEPLEQDGQKFYWFKLR